MAESDAVTVQFMSEIFPYGAFSTHDDNFEMSDDLEFLTTLHWPETQLCLVVYNRKYHLYSLTSVLTFHGFIYFPKE